LPVLVDHEAETIQAGGAVVIISQRVGAGIVDAESPVRTNHKFRKCARKMTAICGKMSSRGTGGQGRLADRLCLRMFLVQFEGHRAANKKSITGIRHWSLVIGPL